MEYLPEELLIIIFEHCSLEDLQSIRLTCKLFYQVGINKKLIQNEVLFIDEFEENIDNYKVLLRPECSRKFYNCSINNINIPPFTKEHKSQNVFHNLLDKFSDSFRELYFNHCSISFNRLMLILKQSPNLRILKLSEPDIFLCQPGFHSFTNNLLKELHICGSLEIDDMAPWSPNINDKILCTFLKVYPNLKHLSLRHLNIETRNNVYSKYYKKKSPQEKPSSLVFTYHCVRDVISLSQNNITGLNLSGTSLNNHFLKEICFNPNLQLNTLNVNFCPLIKWNEIINDIISKLTNLTYINLSYTEVTDFAVNIICSECKLLNTLILSKCSNLTDAAFENIMHLKYLKEFAVNDCEDLSAKGVLSKLQKKINLKSLQRLNLSSICFQDCKISEYTSVLSHLTEFNVSKTRFMNMADLKFVLHTQKHMQKLNLSELSLPEDMFLVPNSTENCDENNQSKLFKKINYAINTYKYSSNPVGFCLAILSKNTLHKNEDDLFCNLNTLNLKLCSFTDKIFDGFYFKKLRNLNLSQTEITMDGILLLIFKCPLIQSLDLSYTRIDDICIKFIIQGFKKLRYLTLMDCRAITIKSLETILKCSSSLKRLTMSEEFSEIDDDELRSRFKRKNIKLVST